MIQPAKKIWLLILGLTLLLSACGEASISDEKAAEVTATPQPSPTASVIWFPPTSTPTLFPTRMITPTPSRKTDVGDIIFSDSLASQTAWETFRTTQGSIAFGNDQLSIAIAEPKAILTTLRSEPSFGDFYASVTANANLCKDQDSYGIVVRADSSYNAYRFTANCSGSVRMERVRNGQVLAVQDWTRSGQVFPGSPMQIRLGVWAVGKEMRFFINDVYQFSVTDPVWSSGKIGVFARSGGDTPVTISFTDLEVRGIQTTGALQPEITETLRPTAEATPTPNTQARQGH